jgi:hypothetical protein
MVPTRPVGKLGIRILYFSALQNTLYIQSVLAEISYADFGPASRLGLQSTEAADCETEAADCETEAADCETGAARREPGWPARTKAPGQP